MQQNFQTKKIVLSRILWLHIVTIFIWWYGSNSCSFVNDTMAMVHCVGCIKPQISFHEHQHKLIVKWPQEKKKMPKIGWQHLTSSLVERTIHISIRLFTPHAFICYEYRRLMWTIHRQKNVPHQCGHLWKFIALQCKNQNDKRFKRKF